MVPGWNNMDSTSYALYEHERSERLMGLASGANGWCRNYWCLARILGAVQRAAGFYRLALARQTAMNNAALLAERGCLALPYEQRASPLMGHGCWCLARFQQIRVYNPWVPSDLLTLFGEPHMPEHPLLFIGLGFAPWNMPSWTTSLLAPTLDYWRLASNLSLHALAFWTPWIWSYALVCFLYGFLLICLMWDNWTWFPAAPCLCPTIYVAL